MSDFSLRGRYVVRITPADVGRRVSVRARVGEDAGGPQFTDAVGTLESWSDGILVIRRRDGQRTEVDEVAMVAGKTLPPPPTLPRG
ncbi:hypothetical protein [Euzebya tangerina]|uniref:putative acetyltransferase n=1 Tax=Euzebya tangerina TaxID=591198 RepID=UPI000E30E20B|nr:hypothetical protein [Euzebya tangerina]